MPNTPIPGPAPFSSGILAWLSPGLLCALLALAGVDEARAYDVSAEEFKYLPEYCKLVIGVGRSNLNREQRATLNRFERRMGCAGDTHHYCEGLLALHRAALANQSKVRKGLLHNALGGFNYTLERCEIPNAPFKPEILTNAGRAYIGLEQYEDAVRVLTEAIARNPKYEAAYAELSTVYLTLNSKDDARRILEDGLKQTPDSKLLNRRLARFRATEPKAGEDKAPEQKVTEPKPRPSKAAAP
jgi:tetratricopeptide (TPR) repeat protein